MVAIGVVLVEGVEAREDRSRHYSTETPEQRTFVGNSATSGGRDCAKSAHYHSRSVLIDVSDRLKIALCRPN
jgi:hypothetical protein